MTYDSDNMTTMCDSDNSDNYESDNNRFNMKRAQVEASQANLRL